MALGKTGGAAGRGPRAAGAGAMEDRSEAERPLLGRGGERATSGRGTKHRGEGREGVGNEGGEGLHEGAGGQGGRDWAATRLAGRVSRSREFKGRTWH